MEPISNLESPETPEPIELRNINFRGIAFEGGGVQGIAHVGALEQLENEGVLISQFTHFAGSSAGSILAMGMACRAPVATMKKMLDTTDFKNFEDGSWITGICRIFKRYGWFRGDALEDWLGEQVKALTGDSELTLKGVYDKYGTYLLITMSRVMYPNTITVYADYKTYPNLPLKVACRRSSGIPAFFATMNGKEEYGDPPGSLYVDGGLLDNYPIEELYKELPKEQVIGIKLIAKVNLKEIKTRELNRPIKSGIEFAESIVGSMRNQALKLYIDPDDWLRTIKVNVGTISAFNFNLTDAEKKQLYESGKTASSEFLKTR
jgi:NTE family protein